MYTYIHMQQYIYIYMVRYGIDIYIYIYIYGWFDLQWWILRCALLMRTNKVEQAVPYVTRRCFPDFLAMIILIYVKV